MEDQGSRRTTAGKEVILAGLDVGAFCISVLLALFVRFGGDVPHTHSLPYLTFMPVLVLWRLLTAQVMGLYDFRHKIVFSDHLFAGLGAAFWGVGAGYGMLALIRLYYWPHIELSRLVAGLDFCIMSAWFASSRGAVLVGLRLTGYTIRVLLIGPVEVCRELACEIREHAPALLRIVGICTVENEVAGDDVLGSLASLEAIGRKTPVDQVILADVNLAQSELSTLLMRCEQWHADCHLFPGLDLATLASTRVLSMAGLPLVPLSPVLTAGAYRYGKRLLDVAAAIVVLGLTAPAVVVVAIALRLESRGLVFLSQERIGLRGRPFRLHKFRTMVPDAEAASGPVLATNDDPRITPVGRTLRRFRIDEVPQLWNVLRGEMSLVGPRPERPEFVEAFVKETPLYARRFLVKPGLTGLAQIHGRYDTEYVHKLRYDLIYMNSISLVTDLRILLATVRTVVTGHGAV